MGQVTASSSTTVDAPPERVLTALADYQNFRPRILSDHYTEYRVLEGGQGDGTVAEWRLQATAEAGARHPRERRRRRFDDHRAGCELVAGHDLCGRRERRHF